MDNEIDQVYYEPPNPPRMKAVCPFDADHRARVSQTKGRTRYCVCQTCGRNFKMIGAKFNDDDTEQA